MKKIIILLAVAASLPALSAVTGATCKMYSRDNETSLVMEVKAEVVSVTMAGEALDECVLEAHSSYNLHVRCGSGEDATYFGVVRTTGKIYADFGTIALLKNCQLRN